MLSVMSTSTAEQTTGGVYYSDQIEDLHGLGELFTPQELPFLDTFSQDFESLEEAGLGDSTPSHYDNQGLQSHVSPENVYLTRQRPPLGKSRRSNPFYSPSRQIVNLVQKKKLSKTLKRESSAPALAAVSLSQLQTQQATPPELDTGNGELDAGSSDDSRN
ncbi:YLR053C [Zygosaccharomyces parabailii]|nr:YLR053C [Zygosaccharomyces parabailii]